MKKHLILLVLFAIVLNSFAQDENKKEKGEPVSSPFESGILIDQQTSVISDVKTLEFIIQHKFGDMTNGKSDLFGIYAPGANVRLALNYVPVKNLQLGIGQTKKNMYTDFNAKWTLLKQTTNNSSPVSVTLYGVAAIDGRPETSFGSGKVSHPGEPNAEFGIEFSDRLSYNSQLIVGRKFTNAFSLQVGASFTHYNMVAADYNHDMVGIHAAGRLKVSPQGSIIFNYDHPLQIQAISEQTNWDTHAKPNLSFGYEIFTFTHAFQMYVGTADGIIPQDIMMYNQNDWKNKGLAVGFTMTRLWMF